MKVSILNSKLPTLNSHVSRTRRLELFGVTLLLIALTAAMTWPHVTVLGTHSVEHQDIYFNLWRLRWIAHVLLDQPANLFGGNVFPSLHWQPLLNGYSGFHPQSYLDRSAALRDFPAEPAIERLRPTARGIWLSISAPTTPSSVGPSGALSGSTGWPSCASSRRAATRRSYSRCADISRHSSGRSGRLLARSSSGLSRLWPVSGPRSAPAFSSRDG